MIKQFKYPKVLRGVAMEIAMVRSELSKSIYKPGNKKHRGDDELQISFKGILAELIARHHLIETGVEFETAPLLEIPNNGYLDKSIGPDIIIKHNGSTMDVKAMSNNQTLLVNYEAHNNPDKYCNYYWFIFADNGTALSIIKKHHEVSEWKVQPAKFTDVYIQTIGANV